MEARKWRERERRGVGMGQDAAPKNPLPPARLYLLQFPEPPQIMSPAGDHAFNIKPLEDTSYSNHSKDILHFPSKKKSIILIV
jgi:hypothetical protein